MMASSVSADASAPRPEDARLGALPTLGYGLQHILAMFGGVIAVPIIVGGAAGLDGAQIAVPLSSCLFVSGVATMLQTLGLPFFGSQLPLVQGISFASVSTLLAIIGDDGTRGLRTAYGAAIVACLIGLALSPFFSHVIRFFPPVVTGSVITVIGLSLFPVAAGWITGQPELGGKPNPAYLDMGNLGLAMFTLLVILLLHKVARLSQLAILLGLVVGTVVALATGKAGFDVGDASVVALPHPLAFGSPLFETGAIVSMTIVAIVIMVETTADILAVGEVVDTSITPRRVGDGLRADMGASALAPLLNGFPATAFAQNVGLVALTGIKSRFAVAAGGAVLAVLGLSPMLAAVVDVIPLPVLGGAGIALFGTVAASGIRSLSKVSYDHNNNLLIVAVAIGLGVIPVVSPEFWSAFPDWFVTIADSGISAASLAAVLLNIAFNLVLPGVPDEPTDVAAAPARHVRPDEAEVLQRGGSFTGGVPDQLTPTDSRSSAAGRRARSRRR